jgi:hypothetical protein
MRGPLVFILVAIFVVGLVFLVFWQLGIFKEEKVITPKEEEKRAEEIINFLKQFDFGSDFQKLRTKLPGGTVKEIIPLDTSDLGVFDPFGLGAASTETPSISR